MSIPRVPWDLLPKEQDASIDRLVLEHSGLAWSFHTSADNKIKDLWLSEAFTALNGYTAEDLLPDPISTIFGPLTDKKAINELLRLRKADEVGTVELITYRKDRTTAWSRLTICPVSPDPDSWLIMHADISKEKERERELADLVEREERAHAHTRMLMGIFDNLTNIASPELVRSSLATLTSQSAANWAGVFPAPTVRRDEAPLSSTGDLSETARQALENTNATIIGDLLGPDTSLAPFITPTSVDGTDDPEARALARDLTGISLIAAPIRGINTQFGMLVLASDTGVFAPEDVELANVISTRLGLFFEGYAWQESNSASTEIMETSVFLAPKSFAGLDIAAESEPPSASDVASGWCDAYQLPNGQTGLVISVINGVGLAVLNSASMFRSTIQACLWKGYPPQEVLLQTTQLAYLANPNPLPTGGIITRMTRRPHEFSLDIASVVHLPLVVRIPGEGFRQLEGAPQQVLGSDEVDLLAGSFELPYGSVLYYLTESAFNDAQVSTWGAIDRLIRKLESVPEDAPAQAYADVIRVRRYPLPRRQQLCYMIVKVLGDG